MVNPYGCFNKLEHFSTDSLCPQALSLRNRGTKMARKKGMVCFEKHMEFELFHKLFFARYSFGRKKKTFHRCILRFTICRNVVTENGKIYTILRAIS